MARPTVLCGPILHIDDCTIAHWRFRIDVLLTPESGTSDSPPPPDLILFDQEDVDVQPARRVADLRDLPLGQLWSYSVSVPRFDTERSIAYTVNAAPVRKFDAVAIPARDRLPRIAGFSCSGFSSESVRRNSASRPFRMWERLTALHLGELDVGGNPIESPIHLLIGGGDQFYSDELRCVLTLFEKLASNDRTVHPAFAEEAWNEFARAYMRHLRHPSVASLLARVPSVMTWDDHEICDGYGSQGDKWQDNPWFRPIYEAARRCFCAFQLGADPDRPYTTILHPRDPKEREGHFMQWVYLPCEGAELDILLLDLRSGRTRERVLSDLQESHFYNVLAGISKRSVGTQRHLILVSSIPLVFAEHKQINAILELLPGKHELIDDLLDHWEHEQHIEKQRAVLRRLFAHRDAEASSIVIFSGDVHSATCLDLVPTKAAGAPENSIHQVVSSGIAHPPPLEELPKPLKKILMDADGREILDGVEARRASLMGNDPTFLERNFVVVEFDRRRDDAKTRMPKPDSFCARWSFELESSGRTSTLDVSAVSRPANKT